MYSDIGIITWLWLGVAHIPGLLMFAIGVYFFRRHRSLASTLLLIGGCSGVLSIFNTLVSFVYIPWRNSVRSNTPWPFWRSELQSFNYWLPYVFQAGLIILLWQMWRAAELETAVTEESYTEGVPS